MVRIKARASQGHLLGDLHLTKPRIWNEEIQTTINECHRWIRSKKVPWIYRLISNIVRWENRTVPRVLWMYHMSHALPEHGTRCFQYFLNHMGRATLHTMFLWLRHSSDAKIGAASWLSSTNVWVILLWSKICQTSCVALSLKTFGFPEREWERRLVFKVSEVTFRFFYKMVEEFLTLKESLPSG